LELVRLKSKGDGDSGLLINFSVLKCLCCFA